MSARLLALAALVCVVGGGILYAFGYGSASNAVWAAGSAIMLVPLTWSVVRTLLHRDVGVDAIALVAIVGALATGEYFAGSVIALMLAGGNALEEVAAGRARRELTALIERAPHVATRRRGDTLEEVPVDDLAVGDVVVVRAGEVVPVDGVVVSDEAIVDESTLTGEPLPSTIRRGGMARSGTSNSADAFELRTARLAAESAYANLVRLVRQAETQKAPFVRLADRYAAIFLPVALLVAGAAWIASGDPVRAVAVLVVATPCPLILAAPIAFIAGVSRAARAGVIVKGGGVIEQLGEARTVLLDKTGTLTLGTPEVQDVVALDGLAPDEALRLAASLDQLSTHPLAAALVREAQRRRLDLAFPEHVDESVGRGITGLVEGLRVAVGSPAWLDPTRPDDDAKMLVQVDGRLVGSVAIADRLREDAPNLTPGLKAAGITHVALVTGDRAAVADAIGRQVGADRVYSEQTPEQKLEVVRSMQARPDLRPVVMVGDGINDAPALALADVGIAMGSAGATVSSETADAVIVVDRIDRVADAIRIGRRSLHIARQSVLLGIGASLVAMGFAAFGYITPVYGALLQEVIDVGVILNALRALR
jgi:heavy metal translocating P-type ATPase